MMEDQDFKDELGPYGLKLFYQNIRTKNGIDQYGNSRKNMRLKFLKADLRERGLTLAWYGEGKLRTDEPLRPPSGYQLIRTKGPYGSFGFLREGCGITHIERKNNPYDISFFEVKEDTITYGLITAYIPPSTNGEHYKKCCEYLSETIEELGWKELCLAGDFNALSDSWDIRYNSNSRGKILEEWILEKDLEVMNARTPTFRRRGYTSTLDLIICTSELSNIIDHWVSDSTTDDHYGIFFGIRNSRDDSYSKYPVYDVDRFDVDQFHRDLDEIRPAVLERIHKCSSQHDARELDGWFWRNINSIIHRNCPMKIRSGKIIAGRRADDRYRRAQDDLDELFRKLHVTRPMRLRRDLDHQINIAQAKLETLGDEIEAEQWKIFLDRFKQANGFRDTRTLFKLFSRSRGNLKCCDLDGKSSEADKCQISVEKWQDIYKPNRSDPRYQLFHQQVEDWRKELSSLTESISNHPYNRPISQREFLKALDKPSPYKAVGDDRISIVLLRKAEHLKDLWLQVFNCTFRWGARHPERKSAIFKLIPKANKILNTPLNGRTISLLSTSSKIEDACIDARLREAIPPETLSASQYAFIRGRSCEKALSSIVQDISDGIFNKKLVSCVLLSDVSKAYPKMWHAGTIYKLYSDFHIRGSLLHWINDFLSNRTARFSFGATTSSTMTLNSGTPEGTCLSCYLFIVYYDIDSAINNCKKMIYCDDATPWITFPPSRWGTAMSKIQADCDAMADWGRKWRLTFNSGKSGFIIFDNRRNAARKQQNWNFRINLMGNVERWTQGRALGLIVDEKLTFKPHAQEIYGRMVARRRFLTRLCYVRRLMPISVRLQFFRSWFVATGTYGEAIWRHDQKEAKRINGLESQTLKRCLGIPGSVSHDSANVLSGILPARYRVKLARARLWCRINEKATHSIFQPQLDNWKGYGSIIEAKRVVDTPSNKKKSLFGLLDADACELGVNINGIMGIEPHHQPLNIGLANDIFGISTRRGNRAHNLKIWSAIRNLIRPSDTIALTDGSAIEGFTGCGIKITFPDGHIIREARPVSSNSCSHFGETAGILTVAQKLQEERHRIKGRIIIVDDNLAACKNTYCSWPSSRLTKQTQDALRPFAETCLGFWAPGHIDEEHEEVDTLAEEGAALAREPHLELTSNETRTQVRIAKTKVFTRWNNEWKSDNERATHLKELSIEYHHKLKGHLINIPEHSITWYRLMLNAGQFAGWLHTRRMHETGLCDHCGCWENSRHVLLECPEYAAERYRLHNQLASIFANDKSRARSFKRVTYANALRRNGDMQLILKYTSIGTISAVAAIINSYIRSTIMKV